MTAMNDKEKISSDLRERKRQLTLDLITQTGLKLFKEHGYEATTLDQIAAASGISRRTFFYYLKSKEDVLLANESGELPLALQPAFLAQSPALSPLEAARKTFLALAPLYDTPQSLAADHILRSIETLRLRKDAFFIQLEGVLAEAMYALWPDPARRPALRLDAMIAMTALRFAKENRRQDNSEGKQDHPLSYYIDQAFDLLHKSAQ
ncbi:MAG: hypothetical protein RLZZ237_2371 [Pseudomonadota bacterium]|jgi:AcrR family transcriptional regulator